MSKVCLALLLALVLAGVLGGCSTHSGSRDYVPGKGWVPND